MTAYKHWDELGKPYKLSRPCKEFKVLLERAGFLVYHYPDHRHQVADPPEDHTPYSETGWPGTSAHWFAHALDIMPEDAPVPLPKLARAIIAAKNQKVHGTKWIKYINWTDESGNCNHEEWQPYHERSSSGDKGHLHISARSDMDDSNLVTASGWNPLEDDMTPEELLRTKLSNGTTINNALVTLLARTPTNLVARLDAILAAALDDGDLAVVMAPETFDELRDIRNEVNALSTAMIPLDPSENSAPRR